MPPTPHHKHAEDAARRIGVNADYFGDGSLLTSVRRLLALGVRGVDCAGSALRHLDAGGRTALKELLETAGARAVAINAARDLVPVELGNLAAANRRERARASDHIRYCIEFAHTLRCPRVVCDLGSTTDGSLAEVARAADSHAAQRRVLERENARLFEALRALLPFARAADVTLVLLPVPGRRWYARDLFPPDNTHVVERHVWPWRAWFDAKDLIAATHAALGNAVAWAFDCANEMVAHGCRPFTLADAVADYPRNGLALVYWANHPGPYHRVWHRLLLHQSPDEGHYTPADYRALARRLARAKRPPEPVLLIRDRAPSEARLRRGLRLLASIPNAINPRR